jgi:TolA-binding protein
MTCEEARDAFTDLYDGTLAGPSLADLSRHLDACPSCREEWASFRAGLRALRALRDAEPDPGFAGRVAARIEAPSPWQRLCERLFVPLRAKAPLHAVALAVLVLAGVWLVQQEPAIQKAAEVRPPTLVPHVVPPASPPPAVREEAPAAQEPAIPKAAPAPPPAAMPAPAAPAAPPATLPAQPKIQQQEAVRQERAVEPLKKAAAPMGAPSPGLESHARRADSAEQQTAPKGAGATAPAAPAPAMATRSAPMATQVERLQAGASSADDLFSGAATAYAAGQFEAAAQGFGTFLAQHGSDPRAADARFFLASTYLAAKRFPEARAEYDTFLRQHPDHRRAPAALYRQAEARLGAGDPAACEALRSALDRHPGEREAAAARRLLTEQCK